MDYQALYNSDPTGNVPTVRERSWQIPPKIHQAVIQGMLDSDIIVPSSSPWASLIVLVHKNKAGNCFCLQDLKFPQRKIINVIAPLNSNFQPWHGQWQKSWKKNWHGGSIPDIYLHGCHHVFSITWNWAHTCRDSICTLCGGRYSSTKYGFCQTSHGTSDPVETYIIPNDNVGGLLWFLFLWKDVIFLVRQGMLGTWDCYRDQVIQVWWKTPHWPIAAGDIDNSSLANDVPPLPPGLLQVSDED